MIQLLLCTFFALALLAKKLATPRLVCETAGALELNMEMWATSVSDRDKFSKFGAMRKVKQDEIIHA